ncbi:phosphatase PAP2 family protein [Sphingobium sp. D43FB]|uniref:acid phosphatase n=1 Tax=Sphingobium sp. D43FB TaxID=2017595 RepID=UPI000BB55968|nr:phosphatase PAP2 family protein [Sphingobium sp. D43FB]PBN43273.1 phosphatase [Sphingobium sp. D43FB]
MKFTTIIAGLCLIALPCAAATPPKSPPSRLGSGYLKDAALAADFSPPPPAPGSAAQARDDEAAKAALLLRDSPRWALATADAELFGPTATAAFSCTAGVAIGPATTPRLDKLLRRTIADFGRSTSKIKQGYTRPRPFMINGQPTCTPDMEAMLRKDGSYPSGHSAIGYGWGLILSQLRPDLASTLVARGRAFGDSRRICNAHWLSDTEEGRLAASATLARLNAEPAFQKDMKAARTELARAKAPPARCDAETAALTQGGTQP